MIKPLLSLFIRDLLSESIEKVVRREAVSQIAESVREEFLRTVAESYSREITHNISQYVKSIEAANVIVSSNVSGEKLYGVFEKSIRTLEKELETQSPDSPVIKYLTEKYKSRQESQSVVGLKPKPVYTMVPGYSESSYYESPWLNRVFSESPEIGEILADEALRIFNRLFSEVT